jgi:hypothetical protein
MGNQIISNIHANSLIILINLFKSPPCLNITTMSSVLTGIIFRLSSRVFLIFLSVSFEFFNIFLMVKKLSN